MAEAKVEWVATVTEGGHVVARVGHRGRELVAEWSGIGRLVANRDGSSPVFEPSTGADPVQRAKLENGFVRLLLRSLHGNIGLHGSAVELHGNGVVLLGHAGDGKSTLAAALCKFHGAALLADDAVALDYDSMWSILPTEQTHFLDTAARNALGIPPTSRVLRDKVGTQTEGGRQTRLSMVVVLTFNDEVVGPTVRRLAPMEALGVLVPHTVRFAVGDAALLRGEADRLASIASAVPFLLLSRPHQLQLLEATASVVRESAREIEP